MFEVDCNTLLPRIRVLENPPTIDMTSRVAFAGALNLDHVRTITHQTHGCHCAGQEPGEIQDCYSIERQHFCSLYSPTKLKHRRDRRAIATLDIHRSQRVGSLPLTKQALG